MQVFGEWAQVEVVELVNDGSGLAFGIVGGRSSGVVVKSVLPGGVADRDGRLRTGDMLLRIGAVCVVGMCARQAAAVLRQCGACVRLLVARPAHSNVLQPSLQSLGASQAPIVPSRLLTDPIELERGLAEAGHDGFGALCEDTTPPSPPPTIIEERLHHRPVASIVAVVPRGALAPSPRPPSLITTSEPQPPPLRLPLDMAVRGSGEPETLSYEVDLNKDSALGLGITVAGYVCEQGSFVVHRLPLDMAVRGSGEPETLSYEVDLNKDSALGLGITVAGYVCEQGSFVVHRLPLDMAVRGSGEPETLSYEVDLNKDSALGLGITVAGYVCEQGSFVVHRLPLDMAVRGSGEPETLSYEVDLNKDSALGLGITVAGYVCEQGSFVVHRLPLDMAVRGSGEPETLSYEVDLNKDSALGLGITVAGYVCEQGSFVVHRLPLDMAVRGSGEPETLSYEVDLNKDSALGLGITVAGYVCEQEELSGIFVKSISAGSSADLCGRIQVNDRIVEVDGVSLHGVTNHRAVALLRDARGPIVRLKALRYLRGAGFERLQKALAAQDGRRSPIAPPSPSVTSLAKYSFSVYDESTVIEAEADSEVQPHLPSPTSPSDEAEIVIGRDDDISEREIRRIQDKWRDILQDEPDWPGNQHQYDIIVGTIMKEKDSGLGISLEGTVRVVGGKEVQARHYIRAIAPNSPVSKLGIYKVGDELLEVNGMRVLGAHHVEVVTRLRAVKSPVLLVVVRRRSEPHVRAEHCFARSSVVGGSLQDLLAPPQRLIKAKSESSVASLCSATTVMSAGHDHDEFCTEELERNRSRSLEPLSGLAMWSDQVEYIELQKEDRGLGFSILDYLDPSEPGSSVIVVRSVVGGGAAAADGRLAPGDRLVSVNGLDVSRSPLAVAVRAIKSAPKGPVTIGVAKPLPCSTVVGGERANGHSIQSSQECINSLASDDQTGMDSFHECLQEYGEGLEVVQICLEPEESSIKDEELSVLADLSYDDCKKDSSLSKDKDIMEIGKKNEVEKINGITELKSSKSDGSLDEQDDEMTITEDDILVAPRELSMRSKSADRKGTDVERCLSKQQSKDLSTSDEMVFAVTPTGLERISFEKYWKESDKSADKLKNDESLKESPNSPEDDTISFYDATTRISVQEQNNSLLYIDHEIDGYETCLDDDSSSVKCSDKNGHKINGESDEIKELGKHDKIAIRNKDDARAKTINDQNTANAVDEVSSYGYPYVEEHIIKQMKSLRIEPLNINIGTRKPKKKSPTKSSKSERHCVEYYNDQAECLKEIRQRKLEEEEEKKTKEDHKRILEGSILAIEKKMQFKKQDPSEESTDAETSFVAGCHKCFLESYAYEITKAYIEKATSCKYCEVIRDMLEVPNLKPNRRRSAPALVNLESPSDTEDEDLLGVPSVCRRKSAGPLKFPLPSRRSSHVIPAMTVKTDRREGGSAQRWGPPRRVTLRRRPGAPLGVSIVGGKVDIIANQNGENGDEKAIFGIFIKNVVPNSPAAYCGELKTGDRILEVDGVCVRTAQHERAVELIKAAKDTVTLTVQSLMTWNNDSSDVEASPPATSPPRPVKKSPAPPPPQHEIKITVTEPEEKDKEKQKESPASEEKKEENGTEKVNGEVSKPKVVYSDSESSDEEDDRELQGRTYSDKGVEIDRASAGAVKRSREEKEADPEEEDDFGYTANKIKKKYANLGDSVVVVKLERSPKAGLGLSLAGHRDRSRMAVFICGMNPAGSAAKASPPIKVGDEILEVNGIVLHGRCHLNASVIIKGLVGPVFKIILLRRKSALEDVAVKPLTQFPVALEEVDDRFANYKGVRDITVKKGPSGLGIMIIEGRHTEAGRGIFVSDLQEGSAAEQAGLNIGDMILAVNRDSLLSCSYDAAAAKLKQTDGVVTLTVCSPNLKDPADGDKNESGDGAGASRPTTPKPPTPSPAKAEPPPDPATAALRPNQDTVIEITTNNEVLGIALLGGSDTHMNGPAGVVLEVYKNGAIAKDGRLKPGDQIRDCNGIAINKDMTYERMCMSIKVKAPKLKMTVYRPDPIQYEEIEVELTKKSGRPLGLNCVPPIEGTGAYIGELLPGSPAEVDGKLQRGDFIVAVDGKDLSSAEFLAIGAALKLCNNKTTVKVKRFKIVPR